jgi:uncharacterized membrane protein (Fun14 family)
MTPVATTLGLGFALGYVLTYFIRKIVRILTFVIGGMLALLLYLQTQELITINISKLKRYSD